MRYVVIRRKCRGKAEACGSRKSVPRGVFHLGAIKPDGECAPNRERRIWNECCRQATGVNLYRSWYSKAGLIISESKCLRGQRCRINPLAELDREGHVRRNICRSVGGTCQHHGWPGQIICRPAGEAALERGSHAIAGQIAHTIRLHCINRGSRESLSWIEGQRQAIIGYLYCSANLCAALRQGHDSGRDGIAAASTLQITLQC